LYDKRHGINFEKGDEMEKWFKNYKMFDIRKGDSTKLIKKLPNKSIKLFYGSPPYPNAKRSYGNWKTSEYLKIMGKYLNGIKNKMRDDGFIIINVKANRDPAKKGLSSQRSLVVEKLAIEMQDTYGLYCVDIEIWVKTNPVPTGVRVAAQDAYEYVLWFSVSPKWEINIDSIRREYKESTLKTYEKTTYKKRAKNSPQYVSKDKKIEPNDLGALPINVVIGSSSTKSVNHPACQPGYLSERYIKATTNEGDIVFDPWNGSGTTGIETLLLKRKYIGFDLNQDYVDLTIKHLSNTDKEEE
jgi:DNA modification methylase